MFYVSQKHIANIVIWFLLSGILIGYIKKMQENMVAGRC